MLILSDFVDFESSVGYFNNHKSPTPWQRKACKGPGVPGDVGWLPVSLIPALFLFIPFF